MDLEHTMQFIVEQQAQLTASAHKHDELIAKHDEQIGGVTELIGRLAQAEIRLVERMVKTESSMAQLFERMDRFIQGLEGNGHKPR